MDTPAVTEFSIQGMHCESCTKTLTRALHAVSGVKEVAIDLKSGKTRVAYDPAMITTDAITSVVEKNGYHAARAGSDTPEERVPSLRIGDIKNVFSHLFFDHAQFHVERRMLKVAVLTFVVLGITELVAYYAFFVNVPNFATRNYGAYIFYLILAVTLSGSALWHLKAYEKKVSCQTGMMIGMTIGMLAGFLLGAILGATNGMFVGAGYGLLVGMLFGVYSGKCCGIMGVMEGLMAGFMGGLMGAMTTFMLINENVLLFFPIIFASSAVILGGLTYMVYKDYNHAVIGKTDPSTLHSYNFSLFLSFAFLLTMVTSWIIVYGPRSVLYQ